MDLFADEETQNIALQFPIDSNFFTNSNFASSPVNNYLHYQLVSAHEMQMWVATRSPTAAQPSVNVSSDDFNPNHHDETTQI